MGHYKLDRLIPKHVEVLTEACKGYCEFQGYSANVSAERSLAPPCLIQPLTAIGILALFCALAFLIRHRRRGRQKPRLATGSSRGNSLGPATRAPAIYCWIGIFDGAYSTRMLKIMQTRLIGALDGIRTRVTDCLRLAAREASILDRTILPELTLSQKTNNIKPFAGSTRGAGKGILGISPDI